MSKTVTEINRLNKEVNKFQEEMKTTLAIKAAKGKSGWDTLSSLELYKLIMAKAQEITVVQYESTQKVDRGEGVPFEEKMQLPVDMANLSMFYRIALEEGR